MKKIIATVGTSIFTNYQRKEVREQRRDDYVSIDSQFEKIEKEPSSQYSEPRLGSCLKHLKETIEEQWFSDYETQEPNKNASAEIKSILAIANDLGKEAVDVYLLATDTVLSRLACELVKAWFATEQTINVQFDEKHVIAGLQVNDKKQFEKVGLINLIEKFDNVVAETYFENCILNVTGGYKGLIPYLTIFSQIRKIQIYYIFEDTDELIKIPQLPIDLDWKFVSEYSAVFNELSRIFLLEGGKTWADYKREKSLPDEFDAYYQEEQDSDNRLIALNAIGIILWKEYGNHFFVKIPYTCKYFKEEINGKKGVDGAIRELKRRLDELKKSGQSFVDLKDTDVKHVAVDDTWVYKHSNPQVRLQYRYDQSKDILTVYNYRFIKSEADDKGKSGYFEQFKKEYANLKDSALTPIGFKKF